MRIPSRSKGQALILVTIGLVAMCGVMGLAVDLGCTFFVKRWAQSAADAAAMAAAQKALFDVGQTAAFSCGGGLIACQATPAACDGALNLLTGCQYATQHGFSVGGHGIQGGANQNVTIAADASTPAPTVPGVNVVYWVTVRASATVPQLFSAVLGNGFGNSSARATAAVVNALVPGQLITMNRENDPEAAGGGSIKARTGNGIDEAGNSSIIAGGPIIIGSNASIAGNLQGSGAVQTPMTFLRGPSSTADWCGSTYPCTANLPDSGMFRDPLSGKGQPPAPTGLRDFPITSGTIAAGAVLPSGNYFAVDVLGRPTGQPIRFTGNATIADGAFGNWVFYGGVSGGNTITFGPGRYILAGASSGTSVMNLGHVVDQSPIGSSINDANDLLPPTNAGEIIVLTDHNYPGLQMPAAFTQTPTVWANLGIGPLDLKNASIALHGLNPNSASVPSDLKDFTPIAIWQDQADSTIKYTSSGNVDISCGSYASPCTTGLSPDQTTLTFDDGNGVAYIWGTIYQPRGAGLIIQPGTASLYTSQLITGYTSGQGNTALYLANAGTGVRKRIVALIE